MKRARVNLGGAIIAVDVRRFGHAINTDEVFGTHSLGSSCDGRVRVDFRSKLGNQKLPFDGREAGFAPNCACWRPESTAFPMLTGTLVTAAGFLPVGFAKSSAGEYAGGIFWIVGLALILPSPACTRTRARSMTLASTAHCAA